MRHILAECSRCWQENRKQNRRLSKDVPSSQYTPLFQPSRIRTWNPFMCLNQLVAFAAAQRRGRDDGKSTIREPASGSGYHERGEADDDGIVDELPAHELQ